VLCVSYTVATPVLALATVTLKSAMFVESAGGVQTTTGLHTTGAEAVPGVLV
jgi:hypothetical protein